MISRTFQIIEISANRNLTIQKKISRLKKIIDCQSCQKFHGNKIREVFCGKPTVRSQRSRLTLFKIHRHSKKSISDRIKCWGLNGVFDPTKCRQCLPLTDISDAYFVKCSETYYKTKFVTFLEFIIQPCHTDCMKVRVCMHVYVHTCMYTVHVMYVWTWCACDWTVFIGLP